MAENRELALVLKLVADQFQAELKSSQGALGQFNSFIKDWKTQLTAAGTALFAVAKSTANFGEEALKGAQKAGQTVETFTALSYAAKLADIDQQQLIVGLKSLSQNMVEASQRTGDGEALFRRLGIAATDAAGQLRPTEQVLFELADVFAKSADGAGKTEAAVKLFGKAGIDLIPFLNQGKAGITGLMEEAKRLGVVLSTEDAQAANAFNDEIKRLESAMRGLTLQVGQGLLPTMTGGLELFSKLITKVRELGSETGTVGQNLKNMSDAFGQTGIGQGLMDAFTAMGFGHRKGEGTLPREQFWFDLLGMPEPGSGVLAPGGGSGGESGGGKPQISLGPDLKKLQEDYRLYITGLTAMGQERLDKEKAGYQLYIQGITAMGQEKLDKDRANLQLYIHGLVLMGEEAKAQRDRERHGLEANAQAWMAYYDQVGGSAEGRYGKEMDLVRATLAQQLDLNVETAGRLVIAWQNKDDELAQSILARTRLTSTERETVELQTLTRIAQANEKVSDDIFAGWAKGLQRYVKDQQSMLGLGADMARRFFQSMEQSSQRFFFDAMEGKINGTKALFASLLDFSKQITSQILGQFVTKGIAGALSGISPGLFSGASAAPGIEAAMGGMIQRFASGGPVLGTGNRDTVPALLTPGEFVLSRRDVSDIKGGLVGGGVSIVINNMSGTPVESAQSSGRGPDGKTMVYVTIREAMKRAVNDGAMDKVLANRFRMIPQAGG